MRRILVFLLLLIEITFAMDPVVVVGTIQDISEEKIKVNVEIPVCKGEHDIKVSNPFNYRKGDEILLYTKDACSNLKPLKEVIRR